MFKPHHLEKASAAALAGLLAGAAFELSKPEVLSAVAQWQSHAVTILFFGILTFVLTLIFLRREDAKLRESKALSDSLMDSLPGAVCLVDTLGNVRRWNTNFLGYSSAEILGTGIMATVAP